MAQNKQDAKRKAKLEKELARVRGQIASIWLLLNGIQEDDGISWQFLQEQARELGTEGYHIVIDVEDLCMYAAGVDADPDSF